jgi:hypothetical protein
MLCCTTVAHLRRVQLAPTPMMRFPDKASVFILVLAAAFLIVLLSTSKHSFEPADMDFRYWIAGVVVGSVVYIHRFLFCVRAASEEEPEFEATADADLHALRVAADLAHEAVVAQQAREEAICALVSAVSAADSAAAPATRVTALQQASVFARIPDHARDEAICALVSCDRADYSFFTLLMASVVFLSIALLTHSTSIVIVTGSCSSSAGSHSRTCTLSGSHVLFFIILFMLLFSLLLPLLLLLLLL